IGSFLFLGPTGVGKTETARALAEFLFDDEQALVRIDMSEYQERHTVSRLIGAPPGYVGYEEAGQLTEAVRRRPYSVILFDEVVIFNPLSRDHIKQIVDIQLRGLRARLAERKIELELTDAAKELLAREGFDPVYGARPLKRAIQQEIVQPLAMRLLRGEFKDGDKIVVDVRNGQLDFRRQEASEPREPREPVAAGA